jgi:KDO2-lipid IV(A) lauroyltransferase
MAIAWYAPSAKLRRLISVHGAEHLQAALAKGQGVLLVTAHFTMLELGVAALEDLDATVTCLYRPQRNALMDAMILDGRSRFSRSHIPRDNVRALIRRLKANDIVLYVPDQTYIGNQSALLPFFGEPAMTNIATSKLAALSGATVLTYFFRREPGDSGYRVEIGPPFNDWPSDDPATDAVRLFDRLEAFIREAPDQYLWTYKKFQRRPPPLPDPYLAE